MRTVHVHTGDPYDILIERGILDRCGAYVRELSQAEKVVLSRLFVRDGFFARYIIYII